MKGALRKSVDGEPDVELDLGLGGHRHQLGVEEELYPEEGSLLSQASLLDLSWDLNPILANVSRFR